MAKNRKVVRYKKPLFHINIGIAVFGVTFIYLIISIFFYFSKDRISFYEITEGKSAADANRYFTGIILRSEEVSNTENAGYINYYVRNGERVSLNSTIYSLDESGQISELLTQNSGEDTTMTDDNLTKIREKMYQFSTNFNSVEFDQVYEFKEQLEGTISDIINTNAIDQLNQTLAANGTDNLFNIKKAEKTGVVIFGIDQFESLTVNDITSAMFDKSSYNNVVHKSNDLVEIGAAAYKTITSEDWSIMIPLSQEDIARYQDQQSVTVKFLKDDIVTDAGFEIVTTANGTFGKINLHRYMIRYASDRYIDVQIIESDVTGLKIPKSSVVEQDFYTIPTSFLSKGGDGSEDGFYKEVYNESGVSIKFITPTIYNVENDLIYVSTTEFDPGTSIVRNDSTDRYQIGTKASLKGVYNINKGYAVFRKVNILTESNEYYIIETGIDYGPVLYDHIVLDGKSVKENQVIFQ